GNNPILYKDPTGNIIPALAFIIVSRVAIGATARAAASAAAKATARAAARAAAARAAAREASRQKLQL
ncbi:MAG: type IV secretion protein Rhs, partial [Hydrococcus sp. RM1_1_31]|nr:type IV secretion protein Rhs [Hydrococcus sp. RM1_1_31]